jgi:hypothetical protein
LKASSRRQRRPDPRRRHRPRALHRLRFARSPTTRAIDGAVVDRASCSTRTTRNFGFNASTDVYGDLVKAGVIDPTKVVRTALQDAASVAGLLITTEAGMIAETPEDKPAMPPWAAAAWAAWAAWTSKSRPFGAQPTRNGAGGAILRPFFAPAVPLRRQGPITERRVFKQPAVEKAPAVDGPLPAQGHGSSLIASSGDAA